MKKYRAAEGKYLYIKNERTLAEEVKKAKSTDFKYNRDKRSLWLDGIKDPYFVGPGLRGISIQELQDERYNIMVCDASMDLIKWIPSIYKKGAYFGEEIKEEGTNGYYKELWVNTEYQKEVDEREKQYRYGTTDNKKIEGIKKDENFGCVLILIIFIGIPIALFVLNCILYALDLPVLDFSIPHGFWEPRHTD